MSVSSSTDGYQYELTKNTKPRFQKCYKTRDSER